MPAYRVLEQGFFEGVLYDPRGKRPVMRRDKPFAQGAMPNWVEPIKETAAQAKAVATNNDERAEQVRTELTAMGVKFHPNLGLVKLEELLAKSRKKLETDAVTFVDAPAATQSVVETL